MNSKAFKIGLSSWTYSWAVGVDSYPTLDKPYTTFDLLLKVKELGCDVLQIADNCPLDQYSSIELQRLKEEAMAANIELEVGTVGLEAKNLQKYLEVAGLLGSKLVRTLPHSPTLLPTFEEALELINDVLPAFEERGIKLGIENHDFYEASWIAKLVSLVNSPFLAVCLDPVNNFAKGESETEVFRALFKHTINFHCKDYRIDRKASRLGFDLTGTPTGKGFLDLDLARTKLDRGITWVVELWTPWQGDITSTVKLEDEWAKESVSYLKQFRESAK